MLLDKVFTILMLAVMVAIVIGVTMLLWKMRSDNGYNMGRNHMHDLGFTDDDITKGQDDADKEFYVFRKPNERKNPEEK